MHKKSLGPGWIFYCIALSGVVFYCSCFVGWLCFELSPSFYFLRRAIPTSSGMELYESRGAGERGRRNGTKNKPNNPNIEGCGKLWQLLGMWAVIWLARHSRGGWCLLKTNLVNTRRCDLHLAWTYLASIDAYHVTSCYERSPPVGDPAVGDKGLPLHLAWNSYESSKRSGRRSKRTRKM